MPPLTPPFSSKVPYEPAESEPSNFIPFLPDLVIILITPLIASLPYNAL